MKITLREVTEAMRKNGYEQITDQYTKYDEYGEIVGACALGQAAINLNVAPSSLRFALEDKFDEHLTENIFTMNDTTRASLPEIADFIEREYKEFLWEEIEV